MTHKEGQNMCVSEIKVEKIVDSKLKLLKVELQGAFDNHLVGIKKDLEYIKIQTTKTNSRTNKHEDAISDLKKYTVTRESDCPFKDSIRSLEDHHVSEEGLKEFLKEQREAENEDRTKFYHKVQAYGVIITGLIGLLVYGKDLWSFFQGIF